MKTFNEILKEATKMFTVYKMDANSGKLSNKEHLNQNELDAWMNNSKFPTILVIEDNSKKYIVYDHDGNKFVATKKKGTAKTLKPTNFNEL